MWEAPAKALVRRYFYEEFLPAQLPMQLLRGGDHLVLLGDSQEEARLLDALGVPSHRVHSVENDPAVYTLQAQRAQRGELKVRLYHGELREFITHYLATNQRFLVLNLDICGFYLTGIDPVMTQILLFARRNPQTVIATYSNVGRDGHQVREGLKSLAICRWLAPEVTEAIADELYGRYLAAGLEPTGALNMVLRHLFWVRSHLEHVILSSVATGRLTNKRAQALLAGYERVWQRASRLIGPAPISYGAWLTAVDSLSRPGQQPKVCELNIKTVAINTYRSSQSFYHNGWFSVYEPTEPTTPRVWLEQALQALTSQPLRFARQTSTALQLIDEVEAIPLDQVVWVRDDLGGPSRQLALPEPIAGFVDIVQPQPSRPVAARVPVPRVPTSETEGAMPTATATARATKRSPRLTTASKIGALAVGGATDATSAPAAVSNGHVKPAEVRRIISHFLESPAKTVSYTFGTAEERDTRHDLLREHIERHDAEAAVVKRGATVLTLKEGPRPSAKLATASPQPTEEPVAQTSTTKAIKPKSKTRPKPRKSKKAKTPRPVRPAATKKQLTIIKRLALRDKNVTEVLEALGETLLSPQQIAGYVANFRRNANKQAPA
ncbi:MAG TPA: hypothetical protein VG992_01785 [Candidatus Saccharimonadales bacterium]|nr:hypothetical protein [Candidatus Saccharimonadales bacterium]